MILLQDKVIERVVVPSPPLTDLVNELETRLVLSSEDEKKEEQISEEEREALVEQGLLCLELEQPHQALRIFGFLALHFPNDAFHYAAYADCLSEMNRYAQAAQAYEKSLELDEEQPEVYLCLAEIYMTLKQPALAIERLEALLELELDEELAAEAQEHLFFARQSLDA